MAVNSHSKQSRLSYISRDVDPDWEEMLLSHIQVKGKTVLDLGCGGGIYTKALAQLGAKEVIGLDFSKEMLQTAELYCKNEAKVNFILGDANHTGLPSNQFDIILNRAVIHHLKDLPVLFSEIYRLLKPGGICIIQDRTLEDCLLPGDNKHLSGYFFELFPTLVSFEKSRRPLNQEVTRQLKQAGLFQIETIPFWETVKYYYSRTELNQKLSTRTGRSILDELSDLEIKKLIYYINEQLAKVKTNSFIEEKNRWTIWLAKKADRFSIED